MRKAAFAVTVLGAVWAVLWAGAAFAKEPFTDSQVSAEVQDKLYQARTFEHTQVQVAYENGVATLSGTVDSLGAKRDALRAVSKLDHVNQVVDRIEVHAADVTPRQIAEQARKDIVTYYAYGIFDNLSLGAEDNKLIVRGQVSQPFKKEDIGNFLSHIRGVGDLENDLEVLPTSTYDDELRIAIARAIYNDPYFVRYADQAIPPIHIIVKNGNVRLEGVVNSQIDRQKAENDARFAATFFTLTNNLRVEGGQK